ncbi:MAG: hypothetical protein QMD13_09310 [Candidatus Bathyarchaeia archaeon]|nr:hypothetical protein [Candidatus Bathyarchaeia archaeon]
MVSEVKGTSVTIPLLRVEPDGTVGIINLGEALQKLINERFKPVKIHLLHITEIPDPSINIGGVPGKKAIVTIIYEPAVS